VAQAQGLRDVPGIAHRVPMKNDECPISTWKWQSLLAGKVMSFLMEVRARFSLF
jgi:hypothetical protein